MKCQNDGEKMEKGILTGRGNFWYKLKTNSITTKIYKISSLIFGTFFVYAWRCPNCGKIELYAEKKS